MKILTSNFKIILNSEYITITPIINGVEQVKEKFVTVQTAYGAKFEKVSYVPTGGQFTATDLFDKLAIKENMINVTNVKVGETMNITFETLNFPNPIIRTASAGVVVSIESEPIRFKRILRNNNSKIQILAPEYEIKKLDDGEFYLYEEKRKLGKIDVFLLLGYQGFIVYGQEFGKKQANYFPQSVKW